MLSRTVRLLEINPEDISRRGTLYTGMGDGFSILVNRHHVHAESWQIIIMNYDSMVRYEFLVPHDDILPNCLQAAYISSDVDGKSIQWVAFKMGSYGLTYPVDNQKTENDKRSRSNRLVYFMRCGEKVKIGISFDPERRREELQRMNADELTIIHTEPGGKEREKELHLKFEDFRSHGEWFEYCDKIEEYIGGANHDR